MPLSSVLGAQSIVRPGVCTSSTRPASPFDGQVIYETDTNLMRIWNGAAWKTLSYSDYTSGSVLQVVSAQKTDTFSTTSTSYTDITGLSCTITPAETSSTILIIADIKMGTANVEAAAYQLVRGSTAIYLGDAAGNRTRASFGSITSNGNLISASTSVFMDSPATTSATTYKIQVRSAANSGVPTIQVNRDSTDSNTAVFPRMASSITVMEISA